ncbi:hypothetical protein AB6A40_008527 [Gnathostoma spinigerum]|uniref:Adiponectin receptor 2 n=1 Tax=Gnathostoma spinigerum TaxID=75299 RepID=A0ABD6EPD1_9BILA
MGSTSRDSYSVSDNKRARGRKYKWGHRRAFSMPNSNGNRMSLSVIDDDEEMDDGLHKRHVVKYRIRHPSNRRLDMNSVLDGAADDLIEIKLPELAFVGHDDNELEIEINEEEVIHPPGTSDSTKNVRTVVKRFWEARWKVTNFEFLPEWLQDNEYLRTGHRPPLSSFSSCFKSIFSLHTETGNIWTHMYGCVAFIGVAFWFLFQPSSLIQWQEKLVFSSFFIGAISCLGLSFAFHTVQCHSPGVGKLFSKLDYTGISFLIIGSFIPWIYYGFACRPQPMIVYMSMIVILGLAAIIVSLWDKFAEPKFRPLRAGVFVAMGLSSIVPAIHFLVTDGLKVLIEEASLLWLLLMGVLYLTGAGIYTSRVPERWFPGKCDLWFQSHQLFHMFVVAAAFVHFHGITLVAKKRLEQGSCSEQLLERYGFFIVNIVAFLCTSVPLTN